MAEKKIHIALFGGEQDGWEFKEFAIPSKTGRRPDVIYVHRACDTDRIRKTKDEGLKMMLASSLAILAYKFEAVVRKENVLGGKQYCYTRFAEADRSLKDPVL